MQRIGTLLTFVTAASFAVSSEGKERIPKMTGENIVLQTDSLRYEIGTNGQNRAFVDLAAQKDYCEPSQPFMVAARGNRTWPSSKVELAGDVLTVSFGDSGLRVKVRVESHRRYLTLTVEQVSGGEADWLQICNLRLKITENVGGLVNAAWNKEFAACVLACNDRTDSHGADWAVAHLCATAYREFGLEAAKVAVIGVPQKKLLEAIEEVEIEQGLPHPMLNGVWIKRAPERLASYLMVGGISEQNVDQVVEFAKGGFGCVEIYPWRSTPSYELNPGQFPSGMAGLKKVADKIHAAGLQLGIHVMQGMVGWGPKDDPYITPKADPRLLQDRHAALATALDPKATELTVKEGTVGWPDRGDLYVEGEILRYVRRTETGFAECQRGLHGTTIAAHPAGARVGNLVNCFPNWGNTVYCPDVNSTMVDEICERIARVFNGVGADMSYFDGGEEMIVQPPHWRNQGRIALGVMKRLKKPVILEGNALYTHLSWHVITRGSPSYDPIYFGRRAYTLRFKGQNPAGWAKNLLTGDVGWFHPHTHSLATDAVTPDEVMLLCLKALGGKAPISFSMDANNPWANKRMPEMLDIIRTCDNLKRREYLSDEVCAELAKPLAEHVLEPAPKGEWRVRPLQFGPPRLVDASPSERTGSLNSSGPTPREAGASASHEWSYRNPFKEQTPWLRLRACTRLAPYGSKENFVLADFNREMPVKVDGTASPDLSQSVETSTERTPDGASAFCYRAENKGKATSDWCRLSLRFPKALDLTRHRRLGLWVRSEGQGGILNIQLAGTDARRDHYIPLDFEGWSYRVLDPPEDGRFFDYKWPYSFTDLMYTCWSIYNATTELNLYYNALPAGSKTACWIGRIEALQEKPLPLQSPALEVGGQKVVFPVSLNPDDYLEVDWAGRCRHFEPNGGLLSEVRPEGQIRFANGDNTVLFSCEVSDSSSPRAEVTLAVKGDPLQNRPGRRPQAAGPRPGEGTAIPPARGPLKVTRERADELKLLSDGKGGFRLMQGLYELVGGEPAHTITSFDGVANVWTVANDLKTPCRGALALWRGSASQDVDYDDPRGLVLETFDDLSAYEMSATNQFEKYVLGGGKQLTRDGPVREGVSQTFTPSREGARVGKSCGVYTAKNDGGAGGWCAKGKRFPKPLNLSGYAAVAFWLHGDGKRETLRFQFRDVAGRHADWLVPIDFAGWRLQVFRTADVRDFDWAKTEYVLFYYNDLPSGTTCTMKFDDLKALPGERKPLLLSRPTLTVNGKVTRFPADLATGEGLTLDDQGSCALWRPGVESGQKVKVQGAPFVLQPGPNRFELSCDTSKGAPHNVTVRVIRMAAVVGP